MSIRLTVQLTIQPGKNSEFESAAAGATALVKANDKGCEMYDLFRSVDDDTRYVMVESWATECSTAPNRVHPKIAHRNTARRNPSGLTKSRRYRRHRRPETQPRSLQRAISSGSSGRALTRKREYRAVSKNRIRAESSTSPTQIPTRPAASVHDGTPSRSRTPQRPGTQRRL